MSLALSEALKTGFLGRCQLLFLVLASQQRFSFEFLRDS